MSTLREADPGEGRRGAVALALGSVVSGLLAYLLFVLIIRGLGAGPAAPVSVLWTQWAFAGAGLTFPLQHWITRSVGAGRAGDVRRAAGRVALLVVAVALVLGALAWLVRDRLFHRDDAWFPVLVVLITLGSALVGAVRGGLGGHGRFVAVAWSLVAENALRCVLVAVLLVAGVHDPVAHGLALVSGSLVVVAWPGAVRFAAGPAGESRPLAFLGGAATGQLVSQVVLTGAPVVLALSGGTPRQVTAMFAALALFRAPYMVALGSVPQLTLRLTRVGPAGRDAAVRSAAGWAAGLSVLATAAAAALGGWLGPALLHLVFGAGTDVAAGSAAVLAAGCTLAVVNLALMVVALVRDRPAVVAATWCLAALVGALAALALGGRSPATAASAAFVLAEAGATVGLALVALRPALRPVRLDRDQEHR